MGSCTYLMKIAFNSGDAVMPAKSKLVEYFEQAERAYSYWQAKRGQGAAKEFWDGFQKDFPEVYKYLLENPEITVGGDYNNDLSGNLDVGDDTVVSVNGKILEVEAYETWHGTDWDHLAKFLKKYLGATAIVWASEENIRLIDALTIEEE